MNLFPDWLAHAGTAYLIIWLISKLNKYDIKCRKYYIFFLIGSIMPDLERILALTAEFFQNYQLKEFFMVVFTTSFHTILGVICVSLALTSFFPNESQKLVYFSFILGGLLHLLLDGMMWPWHGMGLVLFYPFLTGPRGTYSFHLAWPESLVPLIITSIGVGVTLIIDFIQKKSLISLTPLKNLFQKNKKFES
ncbi:MAG: metal-dependent hydrolase [Candidatus Hodarchaeota archaeon]